MVPSSPFVRTPAFLAAASFISSMGLLACSSADRGAGGGCREAPFAAEGDYAAGVREIDVDGLPVEVWYPIERGAATGAKATYDMREWLPASLVENIPADADTVFEMNAYRDIAAAEGSFPVVYFSHGISGFRTQSSTLCAHLATWGYIVAAPEHPERNLEAVLGGSSIQDDAYTQIVDTHTYLQAEATKAGGPFEGRPDFSRVAVMGHSAGGGAVQALVDFEESPLLGSDWVGLATIAAPEAPTSSGIMIGGTTDALATPESLTGAFEQSTAETKRLVVIEGAGHLAFSDLCAIGREEGGVLAIAMAAGLEVPALVIQLGMDGCRDTDLPVEEAWPVINHYATAHLNASLSGGDEGLSDESTACFGGLVTTYRHP